MKKIYFLLVAIFTINIANAQWQPTNGPYDNIVTALAVSGTNIIAGTYGNGVFLSTNFGSNWTQIINGLPYLPFVSITAVAINGNNFFASIPSSGGGIYLSSNNGISWTQITTFYAITLEIFGDTIFAGTDNGLSFSTNNGSSWTNIALAYPVYSFAKSSSTIYAGSNNGVIFESSDNGNSWNTTIQTYSGVCSLVVSGDTIFAGTTFGIAMSTNNGSSWTLKNTGLMDTNIRAVAISGNKIFAATDNGLFLSTNNGDSWNITNFKNYYIRALIINNINIFAGTLNGVFLSTVDVNNSWIQIGPAKAEVTSLAIKGNNIYAGIDGDVLLSPNNDSSWYSTALTGFSDFDCRALIISDSNIFAVGNGACLLTNLGSNCIPFNTNSSIGECQWYALAKRDSSIFVGISGYGSACQTGGVFLYSNNDTSWTKLNTGVSNLADVRALAVKDSNIFVGTNGNGVFLSTDNGISGTTVNTGLTDTNVFSLAIKDSTIFAGTQFKGVFKSTNHGQNWIAVDAGLKSYNGSIYVKSFTIKDSIIFASVWGQGVCLSTNNGANWIAINKCLTDTFVNVLAISDSNIFAGTYKSGVWKRSLYEQDTITTTTSPTNGGLTTGSGIYTFIHSCTVKAVPNPNYSFVNWTVNGDTVSTDTSYTFTVVDSRNIVANFRSAYDTITTSASPTNGGNTTGGGTFSYNSSCTVKATANTGYTFAYWSENGDTASIDTSYTFTVIANRNLVAHFTQNAIQYIITTSASPTTGGTTTGGGTFNLNQSCTVKATTNTGYTFVDWTENGNTVSTDTNYTFTVTANRNLVANFTQNVTQYNITTSASPNTGGTTTGGGTFTANQSCTVKATANTGYTFVNWTENTNIVSTDTSYTFTVTANRNLVANFNSTQGIVNNSLNEFIHIYPNPATDELIIETNLNTEQRLEIINLIGQTIYTNIINKRATVNTSAFPSGIYILKLYTDKETVVRKFVKE